jgi:uncharacterized protein YbjT (DUF2867 family)
MILVTGATGNVGTELIRMSNAVARYHILSEAAVRESGVPWTFLQPSSFMPNTLQWVPQLRTGDVVRAPFPQVRVATTHSTG